MHVPNERDMPMSKGPAMNKSSGQLVFSRGRMT